MVITLVPGVFQDQAGGADTYATIRGDGLLGRYLGTSSTEIPTTRVQQTAMQMLQRQHLHRAGLPALPLPAGAEVVHGRHAAHLLPARLSEANLQSL